MVLKCCVPGCKSNYQSSLKKEGTISIFKVPLHDVSRKEKWISAIPRKDWNPSANSAVCVKHFNPSDVILTSFEKDDNGKVQSVPLKYPRLHDNAVPSIFPDVSSIVSKCKEMKKTDPATKKRKIMKREEEDVIEFLEIDKIKDYEDFIQHFQTNVKLCEWNYKICNENCFFYLFDFKEAERCGVRISASIVIYMDLRIKVFIKDIELSPSDLKWLLKKDLKLSRWSQMENLLSKYNTSDISCSLQSID